MKYISIALILLTLSTSNANADIFDDIDLTEYPANYDGCIQYGRKCSSLAPKYQKMVKISALKSVVSLSKALRLQMKIGDSSLIASTIPDLKVECAVLNVLDDKNVYCDKIFNEYNKYIKAKFGL